MDIYVVDLYCEKNPTRQQCLSHLCIYLCRIPDVILPV